MSQAASLYEAPKENLIIKYWYITTRFFLYSVKSILWLLFAVAFGLFIGWLLTGAGEFDLVSPPPLLVAPKPIAPKPIDPIPKIPEKVEISPVPLTVPVKTRVLSSCYWDVDSELQQQSFLFAIGSANLSNSSKKLAKKISSIIKHCTSSDIEIEGHSDNTGSEEINKRLSQARAEAVAKQLRFYGVKNKIKTEGFGSDQPVASNDTPEGRLKNRRIKIWLFEK